MKKVLFICYYFPPMGMGGTQRAAKFVKYLPDFGWEPIVLTVKDVHYYATDATLLDDIRGRKIIRTESLDPLRLWAKFKKSANVSGETTSRSQKISLQKILLFINRIVSGWLFIPDARLLWLPFVLWHGVKIIKKEQIEVIFTTSPPHSVHLAGILLKWLTGAKLIADFRDDWTGGESQLTPTILHRFINRLQEKAVLKTADRVIGMCDQLSRSLKRKSGEHFSDEKFLTITNGFDGDDFSGLLDAPLYEKFTITHCGSVSRVSDPEPFLRAIRQIFDEQPELKNKIKIQFFGSDIFGKLGQLLKMLELQEAIEPLQYLPHRKAIEQMMRSHVLLLTIIKRTDEEVITSKVFEYLATGKPILLVTSGGAVADLIRRTHRGIITNPNDPTEIKRAILSFYEQFEKKKMKFALPLAMHEFDRKFLAEKLAQLFFSLQKS
ncbi:hypothetical protein B6D60_01000 [candidate division KSB1 bacterium 4484_87]|nr:MAG: hypothetical protein B6D60_01000 [candidate division KSB1 bacterium 4484_87]